MRFTATRGAMSVGESQGGLPPDALVEREAAILADADRLVERYHDRAPARCSRSPWRPARRSRSAAT